jgi:hypothetical protein
MARFSLCSEVVCLGKVFILHCLAAERADYVERTQQMSRAPSADTICGGIGSQPISDTAIMGMRRNIGPKCSEAAPQTSEM